MGNIGISQLLSCEAKRKFHNISFLVALLLLCPWAAIAEDRDMGQGQLEPPFNDNENFSMEVVFPALRRIFLTSRTLPARRRRIRVVRPTLTS